MRLEEFVEKKAINVSECVRDIYNRDSTMFFFNDFKNVNNNVFFARELANLLCDINEELIIGFDIYFDNKELDNNVLSLENVKEEYLRKWFSKNILKKRKWVDNSYEVFIDKMKEKNKLFFLNSSIQESMQDFTKNVVKLNPDIVYIKEENINKVTSIMKRDYSDFEYHKFFMEYQGQCFETGSKTLGFTASLCQSYFSDKEMVFDLKDEEVKDFLKSFYPRYSVKEIDSFGQKWYDDFDSFLYIPQKGIKI